MDRFIDSKFSKKKGNKIDLKSNMDRFIGKQHSKHPAHKNI